MLLRQEAAGDWGEVALEVGADRNWLVGDYPDGHRHLGLVKTRWVRIALRGLPGYDQRVRGRDRYYGGARLTRVGGRRRCSGNDLNRLTPSLFSMRTATLAVTVLPLKTYRSARELMPMLGQCAGVQTQT